jgi:hypothetical protein
VGQLDQLGVSVFRGGHGVASFVRLQLTN